ncbi:MAG: 2-hydroxyacid dehydrogenase [Thermoplasmatota archaeon]
MKVAYMSKVREEHLELLEGLLKPEIDVTHIELSNKKELIEQAEKFDAIIGARVPREFLEKAKNLKYFIIPFAGIPPQDKDTLPDFPELTVINSHFNAPFVAENAWTLLLASIKRLCPIHNKLKHGDWTPRYEHKWGLSLKDKVLLILGYGEIGKRVGKIGKSFNMTVKAIKRTPKENYDIDYIGTNDDLHSLLEEADFIITTLPLTYHTKDYLDKEEFRRMREGVHIVNVGRGPVINEDAFFEALKEGKIGGAGIDTWWIYPPDKNSRSETFPSNYPLNKFDNVVFSPHRSSHVEDREIYRMKDLARILNSLLEEKIINEIDMDMGY